MGSVGEDILDEMRRMQEKEAEQEEKKKEKSANKEEQKKKTDEYREMLQRLQADFENYKKRIEREKTEQQKYSCAHLIAKLLPVLDSFEMAIKNKNTSEHERFAKGMELVYAQLHSLLKEEGLERIDALGERFDPYRHEALMQEDSEKENIVLEEFQKGYLLKDKVLRHSRVKIGRKKENA